MAELFICPLPKAWQPIYKRLNLAWRRQGGDTPEPPKPLVLDFWWSASDYLRRERWMETRSWAEAYGFEHLISEISEEDKYFARLTSDGRVDDVPAAP